MFYRSTSFAVTIAALSAALLASTPASAQDIRHAAPPLRIAPKKESALSDTPVGYTPKQIRHAYGFDQIDKDGTGQTVAVINAFGNPFIRSDLKKFSKQFKLPTADLEIGYPDGLPTKSDPL